MNLLFTPTEHRHAEHEVIMSGAANACPICQAAEIANLKAKLTLLELVNQALLERVKSARELLGSANPPLGKQSLVKCDDWSKARDHWLGGKP